MAAAGTEVSERWKKALGFVRIVGQPPSPPPSF